MNNIILIFLFSVFSVFSFAQENTDVFGEWYNEKANIAITLFEDDHKVSGVVTWMKFPNDENGNPKTDLLNPDESLRTNEIIGMIIMSSFSHIAGDIWDNGTIYIPKKGRVYSGMMRLKDENTLNIRGYIGFSFFERYSSIWTRILDKEKFINETINEENSLIQLRQDLEEISRLLEDISFKPVKEIIQRIEKEKLLIQLRQDLNKIIQRIEGIKKVE